MKKQCLFLLAVVVCVLALNAVASAATRTWKGATSTTWTTPSNWNENAVPVSTDDVVFDPVVVNQPTISASTSIKSLTIGAADNITLTLDNTSAAVVLTLGGGGAVFTINAGGQLIATTTVTPANSGTFAFGGATPTASLGGTLTMSGRFAMGGGSCAVTVPSGGVVNINRSGAGIGGPILASTTFTVQSNGTVNWQGAGSNLFNAGTINLNSGSIFNATSALGMSFSGRTYGNLSLGGTAQTYSMTGAGVLTIQNNLTIVAGNTVTNSLTSATGIAVAGAATVNGTLNCDPNSVVSGAGTFTLAAGGNLGIGSTAGITSSGATGNIQVAGARSFSTSGNYTYNGTAAQSVGNGLPASVNNLTINNSAGVSGTPGILVNGTATLTAGLFNTHSGGGSITLASGATIVRDTGTLDDFPFSNGPYNVTYVGTTAVFTDWEVERDGGVGIIQNLTINKSGGVTNGGNLSTVTGILNLVSGDLTTISTLTMPNTASSTGTTDVIGSIKRTGFVTGGPALSFGNPFNQVKIDSGTAPTDITVNLVKSAPGTLPTAVSRTYTITPNGGSGYSTTLQLHYLDSELGVNNEALLNLWRNDAGVWNNQGAFNRDPISNWVRQTGVTQFSPWALANGLPTAATGTIRGQILTSDGSPLAGAVVRLSGSQNRKTITDVYGNYYFADVQTSGFYTVTPARANFSFSPGERSFSQVGSQTEAAFIGKPVDVVINPLDSPEYFVRQQYLDFLGREPDESGFNFWSDQLLACGGDAGCIEQKTVNVSAAYFLSIEFQQTGGLVDRLYKASYGRNPHYTEFMPDTSLLAHDVVVGRSGWEAQLATNKATFISNWIERPAFHAAFDGLSDAAYVDMLLRNAGIGHTSNTRDSLVSSLSAGTLSRAEVLSRIANDTDFAKARFNEAFVMMEYFGYLQRDPDPTGYQFWLDKLNRFGGNFERADMVKAFIRSGEYRARFAR